MSLQFRRQMPEPDPSGGGGGGGGNPAPFTYGDAHKDYVTNKGWKGVDDVITSNRNLETLLGADKAGRAIIWPKDDADVEGHKALRAKLGVPEKPEDYGLTKAEGDADDGLVTFASTTFHKHGLPKAAAAALLTDMRKYGADLSAANALAAKTKGETELAALHQEWGTAKDANTESAKRFVKELGITEEQMSAVEGALGTATFMKMFHAGGKKLGEHGGPGNTTAGGGGMTQGEARERLEAARTQRSDGKITADEWFAISEKLSPIANPQKAA